MLDEPGRFGLVRRMLFRRRWWRLRWHRAMRWSFLTGWEFQFRTDADADAALRFLCVTPPPWLGMDEADPMPGGGLGAPTLPPDGRH